jgi:hypothetical protein
VSTWRTLPLFGTGLRGSPYILAEQASGTMEAGKGNARWLFRGNDPLSSDSLGFRVQVNKLFIKWCKKMEENGREVEKLTYFCVTEITQTALRWSNS